MDEKTGLEIIASYAAGVGLALPVGGLMAYAISSTISAGKAAHDVITGRDQGLGFREMYKAHSEIDLTLK